MATGKVSWMPCCFESSHKLGFRSRCERFWKHQAPRLSPLETLAQNVSAIRLGGSQGLF